MSVHVTTTATIGVQFEARCSCGWRQRASSPLIADALAVGHRGYFPDAVVSVTEHITTIVPHDVARCNTARHAPDGVCGTHFETHCSCGFGQGADCREHAEAIAEGHRADPTADVISWTRKE